MLRPEAIESAREMVGADRAGGRGWSRPRAVAARRSTRPIGVQIRWILRVTRVRISLPPRASRTPWGAAQPRLVNAKRAMWKLNETPRRRSPQFDPLEGRQLLSGAFLPGPQPEFVTIAAGPPVESSGISGHVDGASLDSSPGYDPAWQGPIASIGGRGGDLYAMAPTPVDQTHAVSSIGTDPGPVWTHGQMDGAESSEGSAPQAGFPGRATSSGASATFSFPSGWAFGGWSFTSGGVPGSIDSAVPSSNAGAQGASVDGQPDGYDPGETMFVDPPGGQDPPSASMNNPLGPMAMEFGQARSRLDPFETAPSFTGPLNATPGMNVAGALAMAPLTANFGTTAAAAVSGAQAVPTAVPVAAQLGFVTDSEGPGGDRAAPGFASGHRVDTRGMVEPGRLAPSAGRSVLATTLSHSLLVPTSVGTDAVSPRTDEAAPEPRGADLIAESLPFAGDSLERSLDDFIRQLEEVDVAAPWAAGPRRS